MSAMIHLYKNFDRVHPAIQLVVYLVAIAACVAILIAGTQNNIF